jgi:hypothetical protein
MSSYRRVPQREGTTAVESLDGSVRSRSERLQGKCVARKDYYCCERFILGVNEYTSEPDFFSSLFLLLHLCKTVGWVIAAYFVARWTKFFSTVWSSPDLNRSLLRVSFLGFGIVTALVLYLTVYLPKVKGLSDSSAWNVYCPRVIPTMVGLSVASYLIFLRALWPVWGFLSPLWSGVELMGILMASNFIPACGLC